MRVLVTGAKGQLGTDVCKELEKNNMIPIIADLPETDITDYDAFLEFAEKSRPDAIMHFAAYTAVDRAESDKDLCRKINVLGTENVAEVCKNLGIKMIYTSTDYVFDGNGENFRETDEPANPVNFYGLTKYEGEKVIREKLSKYFIVRISWVFGENGKNFVRTMRTLSETKDELNVVCDQVGSPTFTPDLAVLLCSMIKTEKYGTYHATNEGTCSWCELAEFVMKTIGAKTVIHPVKTSEYITDAVRPLNSRLSKKSLDDAGFSRLPTWEDAVKRYLDTF